MSSVSFVIPVYNKSSFLKYVIESLKHQLGSFEREFIFIDDGSTDDSYKLLRFLTKNLKNTKIFRQKNKGSANATNVGIKKAMRNSMFNPSQFLVRADLCKKVGGCDERIKFSQEYSLTLKLSVYGNFAKLNYATTILPLKAPGQISEKKHNQIYRVSKALELFIEDNPDLDISLKLYAQRRLTARAWRFARRYKKARTLSKWFKLYLIGFFYFPLNIIETCRNANRIYKDFLD